MAPLGIRGMRESGDDLTPSSHAFGPDEPARILSRNSTMDTPQWPISYRSRCHVV